MTKDTKEKALKRVKTLFQLAQDAVREEPDLAQRYVEIAKKICMRTRLHLPKEFRMHVCKHCKRFIMLGISSHVRIQPQREPHIVVTCLHCGGKSRMPLKCK